MTESTFVILAIYTLAITLSYIIYKKSVSLADEVIDEQRELIKKQDEYIKSLEKKCEILLERCGL